MTREEAITIISNWLACSQQNHEHCEKYDKCEGCPYVVYQPFDIALEMAISALNSLEEVYAKGYDDGFTQAEVNYENDKALSQEPTVTSTDEPMTMVYPTIVCDDAVSREAVIEWLKDKDIIKLKSQEENARKELRSLPSVNPQPCEDAISREDAIKAQCEACDICGNMRYTKCQYFMQGCNEVKCLRDLPPVTQKSGKWRYVREDKYSCSKCGTTTSVDEAGIDEKPMYKFCPYCGAKMESEDNK